MRFSIRTLSFSLLISTVLADGEAILAAINTISAATTSLNNVVTSFPSGLLGLTDAIPLLTASVVLLKDIKSGTDTANDSADLNDIEVITIAGATQSLATTVNTTLTNLIAAKPKFDHLLIISPVVLLNLKLEQSATTKFGDAVVAKVPAALQQAAQGLLLPIADSFVEAIAVYE